MGRRSYGACAHCGEWYSLQARHLCYRCHGDIKIRELYPTNLCRHGADGVPCRCSNAETRGRNLDRTCSIPVDKNGTLCGRHANVGDAPALEDPTWAFGRVCRTHLGQYLAGILDERLGTALFKQAPRGQTLEERVAHWLDPANDFVTVVGGCLVWQRNRGNSGNGYAMVSTKTWIADDSIIKEARGRPTVSLHRLVWALKHGDIAVGNQIHHICGEMACVNTEHLEEISYLENGSEACRVKKLRHENKELRHENRELRKRIRKLEAT